MTFINRIQTIIYWLTISKIYSSIRFEMENTRRRFSGEESQSPYNKFRDNDQKIGMVKLKKKTYLTNVSKFLTYRNLNQKP